MRDHTPVPISTFNGLWQRGSPDECPTDHFTDCENIRFIATSSFGTRPGVGISQDVAVPLANIKRAYNFATQTANTLLVLTYDGGTNNGKIYHVVNSTTVYGPILTVSGMIDFAFVPYAGRAYISPFTTFITGDLNIEKGITGEFLYVYDGLGHAARKAAGSTPAGIVTAANGAAGHTDAGWKVFAVVGETDTGFLSAPCAFFAFFTAAGLSVSFSTIPTFTGAQWTKRHIVSTKTIPGGSPANLEGYQFFFIPGANINDNVTTVLANQSFFDADLLADASHLIDNYSSIPAGAVLSVYHDRLCLATTFTDISLILVSSPGEPEAISQLDGLIIVPLDGNPITNMQEMRDVFYVTKRAKTVAYNDNGDVPSSWPLTTIDNALGTSVHGIATVLDSGSSSVDFLIVCTFQGVTIFNGKYQIPELSWKIEDFWRDLDRTLFRLIQVVNAPIQKEIYIVLPNKSLLVGNYGNGMDFKKIRWCPWTFTQLVNTIAIVNIDEIVLGSDRNS